jgi:hypothetical protein
MSGWTATECARGLRAHAVFESEEDRVVGGKAREEVSRLPVPRAPSAGPARGEEGDLPVANGQKTTLRLACPGTQR